MPLAPMGTVALAVDGGRARPRPRRELGAPGRGEGRAARRPAGGSRACPWAPSCRRRAPPPPPTARARSRLPARPLRVLSRVSPRPSPDLLVLSFPPAFFLSSLLGLKMPSATSHSGSGSKSSGPPPPSGSSGSEAAAGAAAPASQHPATGTGAVQTEAMKQILGVIDKKLRNLEKKKVRGVSGEGGLVAPALHRSRRWMVLLAQKTGASGRCLSPDPNAALPLGLGYSHQAERGLSAW